MWNYLSSEWILTITCINIISILNLLLLEYTIVDIQQYVTGTLYILIKLWMFNKIIGKKWIITWQAEAVYKRFLWLSILYYAGILLQNSWQVTIYFKRPLNYDNLLVFRLTQHCPVNKTLRNYLLRTWHAA